VVSYSNEVQQPRRATAVLYGHRHTQQAAPLDHDHGRADSLHPDGSAALAAQMLTILGVPHACHDVETTAVIGSHSKTPQTTSDLGTSRSRANTKLTPKQSVALCAFLC